MTLVACYLDKLKVLGFEGDICQDIASRSVMSTDNSVYQLMPTTVLYPKHHDDVVKIFQLATQEAFKQLTFSARGGGTGTNGQSLTTGIMIVFTKYMNNIININLAEQSVTVQPGVILDQLNNYLKPYGYFFAPNLSPSNRATLGGMLSTDASGKGSCLYGKTSQHILALKQVTVDGKVLNTFLKSTNDISDITELNITKSITNICTQYKNQVATIYPKLLRYMTGYDLAHVCQGEQIDISRIVTGAEGTLTVVTELKLKITKIPSFKVLFVLKHQSFEEALAAAEWINQQKPSAVEVVDETVMQLAQKDMSFGQVRSILLTNNNMVPNAISLVEFIAKDEKDLDLKKKLFTQCLLAHMQISSLGYHLTDIQKDMQALWLLRKRSVELIGKLPEARRPVSGIEDTVVDPKYLKNYIMDLKKLLDHYGLKYAMYGHIDAGCIHVRPALDLTNAEDKKIYHQLSNQVAQLVQSYHGLIWGEHGKGFRSEYIKQFVGEEIYQAFKEVKTIFDPYNRLNPGKIVAPKNIQTSILTIDAIKKADFINQISMQDKRHYVSALLCNGNAACLQYNPNEVICPSYKVTKNPVHSPKGRASILNNWLLHKNDKNRHDSKKIAQECLGAFESCLGCKACIQQCPVAVNIPQLKSKFYQDFFKKNKRKLKHYCILYAEKIHLWLARIPRVMNYIFHLKISQYVFNKIGFVSMPCYSIETWQRIKNNHQLTVFDKQKHLHPSRDSKCLYLLVDWLCACYNPNIVLQAYELFQALGYKVYLLEGIENGKAFYNLGMRNKFEKIVNKNSRLFNLLNKTTGMIVGFDPSLTLLYRDEYAEISQENSRLNILLLQELLMQIFCMKKQESTYLSVVLRKKKMNLHYYLFLHCTECTNETIQSTQWQSIFEQIGLSLTVVKVGCCGMAGSYGYELSHVNHSKKLFEMSWQRAMREYSVHQDNMLVTGFSCREQVKRLMGFTPKHPIQVLHDLFLS